MILRAAKFAISCTLGILPSCSDPFVRARVAETEFCVPRENIVDTEYWWIPTDLPRGDGFRFRILNFFEKLPTLYPNRDVKGRVIGLGGGVTPSTQFLNLSRPHSNSYSFRQAQAPVQDAKHIVGSFFAVNTSLHGNAWDIWKVENWSAPSVRAGSVAESGRFVASCRKFGETLRNAYVGTSCDRVLILDQIAVHYWFSDENLPHLGILDAEIGKHILAWRCTDGGAGH
jgi:hypothetical protein